MSDQMKKNELDESKPVTDTAIASGRRQNTTTQDKGVSRRKPNGKKARRARRRKRIAFVILALCVLLLAALLAGVRLTRGLRDGAAALKSDVKTVVRAVKADKADQAEAALRDTSRPANTPAAN